MVAFVTALACTGDAGARLSPVREPIVIAHRGASGLRPEHTLTACDLAIDQGAGRKVHPWTFRAEEPFLPQRFRGMPGHAGVRAEIAAALAQGIDGFFSDFPGDGAAVRNGDH